MERPPEEEWVSQQLKELQIYLDARRLLDPPPALSSAEVGSGHSFPQPAIPSHGMFNSSDSCLVFIGCNYFVLCTREQGRAMLDRQIASAFLTISLSALEIPLLYI